MIMNSDDEKFFENLSAGGETPEVNVENEGYDVELARANAVASPRPKMIRTREEASASKNNWDDGEPEGQLTVDVYQTANDIVVESAIAGVDPQDIDVNVTTDSISIRGSRKREKTVKDEDYLYQECYWGKFGRSIILPQEVDPEEAEVKFKNGILTVVLPKANKKKTRKLKIQVQ
jgi:HSP20 family molecular chaperone IbpA